MAEQNVIIDLVTPDGTVRFNDYANANGTLHVETLSNSDGPVPRFKAYDRPGRDGAVLVQTAPLKALYPVVTALVVAPSFTRRRELVADLRKALNSIREADGQWRWTPPGGTQRQYTVRLSDDGVDVRGEALKRVQFGLVVPDPFAESTTVNTVTTTSLVSAGGTWVFPFTFPFTFGEASSGGSATPVNGGDANAWPTVKLYGLLQKPRLRNITADRVLEFEVGFVIADGSFVEVRMKDERVLLNGSELNDLVSKVNYTVSEFWPLVPGANSVQLSADQFNASGAAVITWRDAYR